MMITNHDNDDDVMGLCNGDSDDRTKNKTNGNKIEIL